MKVLSEVYYEGIEDAIKLIERGVKDGLSLADSLDVLKTSVKNSKPKKED